MVTRVAGRRHACTRGKCRRGLRPRSLRRSMGDQHRERRVGQGLLGKTPENPFAKPAMTITAHQTFFPNGRILGPLGKLTISASRFAQFVGFCISASIVS
jgi:hypothetical protein